MIPGKDFKFRDDIKTDTVSIELLIAPYNGIVYRYISVGIKELEDGSAKLRFQYEIIEIGKFKEKKLRKDEYFQKTLGLILNEFILETLEDDIKNDDRTEYIEEPVEARGLR